MDEIMSPCDRGGHRLEPCKGGYLIDFFKRSGNAFKRKGAELNLREVRPDYKSFNTMLRSLYFIQKPVVNY